MNENTDDLPLLLAHDTKGGLALLGRLSITVPFALHVPPVLPRAIFRATMPASTDASPLKTALTVAADFSAAMSNKGKNGGPAREAACQAVTALIEDQKTSAEPHVTPLINGLLELLGDKVCPL